MNTLPPDEAVKEIVSAVSQNTTTKSQTERLAQKFVYDVLDYCNRDDFPQALVFTAVDFVMRWQDDVENGGRTPLKSLTQNDTTYQFAVADVASTGSTMEDDFNAIKSKLNLYRRPKCL